MVSKKVVFLRTKFFPIHSPNFFMKKILFCLASLGFAIATQAQTKPVPAATPTPPTAKEEKSTGSMAAESYFAPSSIRLVQPISCAFVASILF